MVAAVAAGLYRSLPDAASAMGRAGRTIVPSAEMQPHYDARYRTYLAMEDQSRALEDIMASRRPRRSKRTKS